MEFVIFIIFIKARSDYILIITAMAFTKRCAWETILQTTTSCFARGITHTYYKLNYSPRSWKFETSYRKIDSAFHRQPIVFNGRQIWTTGNVGLVTNLNGSCPSNVGQYSSMSGRKYISFQILGAK